MYFPKTLERDVFAAVPSGVGGATGSGRRGLENCPRRYGTTLVEGCRLQSDSRVLVGTDKECIRCCAIVDGEEVPTGRGRLHKIVLPPLGRRGVSPGTGPLVAGGRRAGRGRGGGSHGRRLFDRPSSGELAVVATGGQPPVRVRDTEAETQTTHMNGQRGCRHIELFSLFFHINSLLTSIPHKHSEFYAAKMVELNHL